MKMDEIKNPVGVTVVAIVIFVIAIKIVRDRHSVSTPPLKSKVVTTTSSGPRSEGATPTAATAPRPGTHSHIPAAMMVPPPPADGKVWQERDYKVFHGSSSALIGVEKDGIKLLAPRPELQMVLCNAGSREKCVRFPNGQLVRASRELVQELPMRETFDPGVLSSPASSSSFGGGANHPR